MKIAILAFDGLEYNLVKRFKLESLKQKHYGKISIPSECYTETMDPRGEKIYEPWTPYVWSAFLTGKLPTETGISKETLAKWDEPFLQFLRVFSMKIGLSRIKNKRKLLEKIGFKRKSFSLEDYRCYTIFNFAKTPRIINVPTISKKWGLELEGNDFSEMLRASWQRFHEIRRKTLLAIEEKDWDLLMGYTRLLDIVGELCYGNFRELFKAYSACNRFISEVKERISGHTVCLIISDHGMERFGNTPYGKHSNHAFYSLNLATDWKPMSILDFFDKIKYWLMM